MRSNEFLSLWRETKSPSPQLPQNESLNGVFGKWFNINQHILKPEVQFYAQQYGQKELAQVDHVKPLVEVLPSTDAL